MDNKIKILYSTIDRRRHVIRNCEFFKWELLKMPNVQIYFIEKAAHVRDVLKELNFMPDFIFFDDFAQNKPLFGLEDVDIPKGVFGPGFQKTQKEFRCFVQYGRIDLIFSFYRDAFYHFFPEFIRKFRWLPNHAYTEIFKDYGLPKKIDFLLMGALNKNVYPLRTKIAKEMAGVRGFVYHQHPGYRDFSPAEEQKKLVGEYFAKEVNRAKIFFTDNSIYKYSVAKYFEIPACNTLLLAPGLRELRDLGFIDCQTFVEINEQNYRIKAKYYLAHEKERQEITSRGCQLVNKYHSTAKRAQEFIEYIRRYLMKIGRFPGKDEQV